MCKSESLLTLQYTRSTDVAARRLYLFLNLCVDPTRRFRRSATCNPDRSDLYCIVCMPSALVACKRSFEEGDRPSRPRTMEADARPACVDGLMTYLDKRPLCFSAMLVFLAVPLVVPVILVDPLLTSAVLRQGLIFSAAFAAIRRTCSWVADWFTSLWYVQMGYFLALKAASRIRQQGPISFSVPPASLP